MFGYVIPEKNELKVKELEMFKAFYCGLCKNLKVRSGSTSTFLLNYDCVFLAIFLSSLYEEKFEFNKLRCLLHPIARKYYVLSNPYIDYATDINMLLSYYKIKDDWQDEKKVLSYCGESLLRRRFKRIHNRYPEKCEIIEKKLYNISQLEKEKCDSIDMIANEFAELMSVIFTFGSLTKDEGKNRILSDVGYNMGRWIYIIDAFDDIEKDIKENAYNPFIYHYKYIGGNIDEFKKSIKENVEFDLTFNLDRLSNAVKLLDFQNKNGIIKNVIYEGMYNTTMKIMNKSLQK